MRLTKHQMFECICASVSVCQHDSLSEGCLHVPWRSGPWLSSQDALMVHCISYWYGGVERKLLMCVLIWCTLFLMLVLSLMRQWLPWSLRVVTSWGFLARHELIISSSFSFTIDWTSVNYRHTAAEEMSLCSRGLICFPSMPLCRVCSPEMFWFPESFHCIFTSKYKDLSVRVCVSWISVQCL